MKEHFRNKYLLKIKNALTDILFSHNKLQNESKKENSHLTIFVIPCSELNVIIIYSYDIKTEIITIIHRNMSKITLK